MSSTAVGFSPSVPGFTAARETQEAAFMFQTYFMGDVVFAPFPIISSTATDFTNTPTSILRPGLIMAKLDSDGSWVAYSPGSTDGSQEARGVLVTEVNMTDYSTGSPAARVPIGIVISGKIKAGAVIGLNQQARNQLAARGFLFDDDVFASARFSRIVEKAVDYTVVAADSGKLFVATAAVNFTLPTISAGLSFEFLNAADSNMTVTSPTSDNVILDSDASGDSVAFSTASHKIGGHLRFEAIYIGGTLKWMVSNLSYATNTVTTTT